MTRRHVVTMCFFSVCTFAVISAQEIHVDKQHPRASDDNPGNPDAPLLTIQRGAEMARAGDAVVVHGGTYREHVYPVRSGKNADNMITFKAADNEEVIISCSEPWDVTFEKTTVGESGQPVWRGRIPSSLFTYNWPVPDFNPYTVLRDDSVGYKRGQSVEEQYKTCRPLKSGDPWTETTGMVIYKGMPLRQAAYPSDLENSHGFFLVDRQGTSILFRLPGDAKPQPGQLELAVRQQAFAPRVRNLRFIKVDGFTFEYAANDTPYAAFGMVSTSSGRYWTFKNCEFRYANAVGLTFGPGNIRKPLPGYPEAGPEAAVHDPEAELSFDHIIRNCRFHANGQNGIFSYLFYGNETYRDPQDKAPMMGCLIEGCVFTRNNWHGRRKGKEAALKLLAGRDVLIRGNYLADNNTKAIWIDHDYGNIRITQNLIVNNRTYGVQFEVTPGPGLVDNNIVLGTNTDTGPGRRAIGVCVAQSSNVGVENNLIANNLHAGVMIRNNNRTRHPYFWHGQTPLANYNTIKGNIIQVNGVCAISIPLVDDIARDNRIIHNVMWGLNQAPWFELNSPGYRGKPAAQRKKYLKTLYEQIPDKNDRATIHLLREMEAGEHGFSPLTWRAGVMLNRTLFEQYLAEHYGQQQGNVYKELQAVGYNHPYAMDYNPHDTFQRPGNPKKLWADIHAIKIPAGTAVQYDYFGRKRSGSEGQISVGPFAPRDLNPNKRFFVSLSTYWPNPGALQIPPEKVALDEPLPPQKLELPMPAPWNRDK